ncbi:MAG: 5-formyltetrahydrofolate cyclo-ligase [Coriobacteriales bacterium]|nr:5-formyltetrahydrofolate cyclo-ligase [Coriobacteriales bacterium]
MTSERDIAALKHAARERARRARAAIDPETRAAAAGALAEHLLQVPQLERAGQLLLAYAALPEEIDPAVAVARLRQRGYRVAYPRVESKGFLGLRIAAEGDLEEGTFCVREPRRSAFRVEPAEVDVVLVPGVAFDEQAYRLGYGGGYYDRLLPLIRAHAVRIGVAFDEQVVEELPLEEHDVRVDMVVTPTRVIRPNG